MTLPQLNRKLVLEAATRVPDLAGGYDVEWEALGTLWAEVTPGTGRERGAQALSLSRVPLKITVRATAVGLSSRPAAGQRFREGTRIYTILAVTERDTAGRYLVCRSQEEAAA